MNEEIYSQQYATCDRFGLSGIKLVTEHILESAIDSNDPKVKLTLKKPSNIPSTGDSKGLKRKGKILALDMSQVSTAITAVDDDEPRSCDVAIQCSYADNQCSRVTDFLFVGSENVARQKELLLQHGITHVVNCSGVTSPNFYEDTFNYKTLKLNDSPKEDVLQLFKEVVAYINEAVAKGGRVFIHCQRGVSRGPTIALSYLMWQRNLSYEEAYPLLKSARSVCCPNPGFVFQLLEWEHQCKLFSPCPSPTPSSYNRIAEFPLPLDTQICKSADIRLLSRDKVSCP